MIYAVVVIIEILDLYKSFLYRFLLSQNRAMSRFGVSTKSPGRSVIRSDRKYWNCLRRLNVVATGNWENWFPWRSQRFRSILNLFSKPAWFWDWLIRPA